MDDALFTLLVARVILAITPWEHQEALTFLVAYMYLRSRRPSPPRLSVRRALGGAPLDVEALPSHVFPGLFRFTRDEFPALLRAYRIPGIDTHNFVAER